MGGTCRRSSALTVRARSLWSGRITCGDAPWHETGPAHRADPSYRFMRDGGHDSCVRVNDPHLRY